MPPKKKKSKKKSKKVKEYLPMLYEFPSYEDPDLITPQVNICVKLADPPSEIFSKIFCYFCSEKL